MKKLLMSAFAIGTLVLLASCDKEVESTDLKVDLARKSPLKIYVFAELDNTKGGFEYAPEGTKVLLSVSYADFSTPSAGKWIDTVKVNASGFIDVMVPVDDNGVNLNIEPVVFEAEQTRKNGTNTFKSQMIYKASLKTVALSTSSNDAVQVFYGATAVSGVADYNNLLADLAHKAPVKAYIYAELDKTKAGFENAPEGTKVVLSVAYSDFSFSGVGKWIDTVKVNAGGFIEAMIPVDDNGVSLSIEPVVFEAEQTRSYGSNSAKMLMIYKAPLKIVGLSASNNDVVQVFYGATALSNFVDYASLTLTLKAETDNSLAGIEIVPFTAVTLYNDGWVQTYTSDADGKILASVPAGENIFMDVVFSTNKKIPDPDNFGQYIVAAYKYEGKGVWLGSFNSTSETTHNLGDGTEVK